MSKPVLLPYMTLPRLRSIGGCLLVEGERVVAEETPVAFVVNGVQHTVTMATPNDMEDFAVGFCLSNGIITRPEQITELVIDGTDARIELRMAIIERGRPAPAEWRRRQKAHGDASSHAPIPVVPISLVGQRAQISAAVIESALTAFGAAQTLNQAAQGLHAAALWRPDHGLVAVREDIGRLGALDKLAGALARAKLRTHDGIMLATGRASVEVVQKAARLGAHVLVATEGPTALAIRTAEQCGITLIALAHGADFSVFSHTDRIAGFASATPARNYAFMKAA